MTEPDPKPLAKKTSFLNEFYKDNQVILDRLLYVVITAILASVFHVNLSDIKQDLNSTKDVATESAVKADAAADVGKANLKANAAAVETLAAQTGNPVAAKAAREAKQELANLPATQAAK